MRSRKTAQLSHRSIMNSGISIGPASTSISPPGSRSSPRRTSFESGCGWPSFSKTDRPRRCAGKRRMRRTAWPRTEVRSRFRRRSSWARLHRRPEGQGRASGTASTALPSALFPRRKWKAKATAICSGLWNKPCHKKGLPSLYQTGAAHMDLWSSAFFQTFAFVSLMQHAADEREGRFCGCAFACASIAREAC